ncbi:MAG: fimbrial protein [Enterobacteriaceae bacterium]|nr:fimbrial protein [Enterobacteriaceae bacterium]
MSNKVIVSLIAGQFALALALPALADESGKVNFSGKIVADTCEINVDDSGTDESTVTFADTFPSDYSGDGSVGTTKAFKISLQKCDPLVANLNLKFTGTTTDTEFKRLKNDLTGPGNATNVGITVKNENGATGDVLFNGAIPESTTDVANDPTGTTSSVFNYTASVIQVGDTAPTAGQYSASATFDVIYR